MSTQRRFEVGDRVKVISAKVFDGFAEPPYSYVGRSAVVNGISNIRGYDYSIAIEGFRFDMLVNRCEIQRDEQYRHSEVTR